MLLTTLKVDSEEIKKVSLKIRTAEGQLGSLQIFVLPRALQDQEDSTCATLEVPLKPLNLHERISGLTQQELSELPLSTILMKGNFSQSDALIWVSNCIPNVPTVMSDVQEEAVKFHFKSSFTHTYLIIELQDGLISVMSDNFSVITIVKD